MSCKTIKKKSAWQASCRLQVRNGLINQANGSWILYNAGNAMHRDQRAGYRIDNAGKKRREKKAPVVE